MFDPDFHFPEGRQFADDEREASKRVMKAWSNFARNGNPGWDKFNLQHQTTMRFSTPTDVKTTANENYTQKRLKLWVFALLSLAIPLRERGGMPLDF